MPQENYPVHQGASIAIDVTLRNSSGAVVTTFTGSEGLDCVVWPGAARPATFAPSAAWTDPSLGAIRIVIADADTAAVESGRYQLLLRIDNAGEWVAAYECSITVVSSIGSDTATKTYTRLEDLTTYGRSWLSEVQGDEDQAGFAEQQEAARQWIERVGHAHFRTGSMALVANGMGTGPRIWGGRSAWLQQQFDADALIVTDDVRECCAKYALSLICEGMIGTGDASASYGKLARMYRSQAYALASGMTLELDPSGGGISTIKIDCSSTNTLFG